MSSVIAFESGTPEQELAKGAAAKFDYSQVDGALRNDVLTAETIFARCAKKQLRDLLGETEMREEGNLPIPVWHAAVTVTLPFDGKVLNTQALSALTKSLAVAILAGNGLVKIILVGALNVKLLQVGADLYTFGLRQKWGIYG